MSVRLTAPKVMLNAKYVHTNLIANDWRALVAFYESVFGCTPVLPERAYTGPALDAGTGIAGATLKGMHLRLPGHGANGPTLEIFSYAPQHDREQTIVNRPGFGHIAFTVDDVASAREEVLVAGGRAIADVTSLTTSTGAVVTWCYVTDIEDNLIELQSWRSS